MSFILDALKKSETERQQSNTTEFAGVPTNPGTPSVPRWLLLVGLLLAINLAVLIGLLLRSDEPRDNAAPMAAIEIPTIEPSTSGSFADQFTQARDNPPARQPAIPQIEERSTMELSTGQPGVQADLISQDPSSVSAEQLYPSVQELRASGAVNLPPLHLDIHVFGPVPEDRFVFINMAKLREGSQMEEGPRVVEIVSDGVILEFRGQSFVLPRE